MCGTISVIVVVVVGVAVATAIIIFCELVNCGFSFNGGILTVEEAAIIVSLVVALRVGWSFYKWCCNWFDDEIEVPDCGCPEGFTVVCPSGYTYDGCNCGRDGACAPNGTSAFVWNNNYYFTPLPGNICPPPAQFFDNVNCYVGWPPSGWNPFAWNNCFYVERKCTQ